MTVNEVMMESKSCFDCSHCKGDGVVGSVPLKTVTSTILPMPFTAHTTN
jgi:hypothetical protein